MARKQLPVEFREFVKCLNSNNVKYLLVGGWAVGLYGHPRATKDIDFLVATDKKNMILLQKALCEFKAPPINIEAFNDEKAVYRLGSSPTQIDIINTATGIDINDCWKRKVIIYIDEVEIKVVAKNDLIKNKISSGRYNDLADVEKLKNKTIPKLFQINFSNKEDIKKAQFYCLINAFQEITLCNNIKDNNLNLASLIKHIKAKYPDSVKDIVKLANNNLKKYYNISKSNPMLFNQNQFVSSPNITLNNLQHKKPNGRK